MPRTSRISFIPNYIFSVLSLFKCDPGETNKQINFSTISIQRYHTPTSSKETESDELLYTNSVTRYGPRASCVKARIRRKRRRNKADWKGKWNELRGQDWLVVTGANRNHGGMVEEFHVPSMVRGFSGFWTDGRSEFQRLRRRRSSVCLANQTSTILQSG